ncbi:MAG: hypothetical protein AAFX78_01910 [Cyanobacteria bacterium J06638_20]
MEFTLTFDLMGLGTAEFRVDLLELHKHCVEGIKAIVKQQIEGRGNKDETRN